MFAQTPYVHKLFELFDFHGEFQKILCGIRQRNPLFSSPELKAHKVSL